MGLFDDLEKKLDSVVPKSKDADGKEESLQDRLRDVADTIDDKAEEFAKKEGVVGDIAGKAHTVLDKVDRD